MSNVSLRKHFAEMTSPTTKKQPPAKTSRAASLKRAKREAAVADHAGDYSATIPFDLLRKLYQRDSTLSMSTVLVLLQVAKHHWEGPLATTQAIADSLSTARKRMSPQAVGRALKRLADGGDRPEIGKGLGLVSIGQDLLHEGRGRPQVTAALTKKGVELLELFIISTQTYVGYTRAR
jgi:hypothetical protein